MIIIMINPTLLLINIVIITILCAVIIISWFIYLKRKTSEKLEQEIFNNTNIGIEIFDENGDAINVNNAMTALLGIKRETLLNRNIYNSLYYHSYFKTEESKKQILLSNIDYSYEKAEEYFGKGKIKEFKEDKTLSFSLKHVFTKENKLKCIILTVSDASPISRLKFINQSLIDEKDKFLSSLSIGVSIYDDSGLQQYVNDAYCELFCIKDKEEFLQRKNNLFNHPALSESDKIQIKTTKNIIRQNYKLDYSGKKALNYYSNSDNNNKKTINALCSKIYNPDGTLKNYTFLIYDMTQDVLKRKMLEENEKHLRTALSMGGLTSWEFNIATKSFNLIFGEKLMNSGESIFQFLSKLHPEDKPNLLKSIKDMLSNKHETSHNILRFIQKGNNDILYYDVLMSSRRDKAGNVSGIYGLHKDITRDFTYREELELNKKKTNLALQATDITQWDYYPEEDRFNLINEPLFNTERHDVKMNDYLSVFHPDDLKKNWHIILGIINGQGNEFEFEIRSKDPGNPNSWTYNTISGLPIKKDSNGKVIMYTGFKRDNTKWIKINEILEKSNRDLDYTYHLLKTIVDKLPCCLFMKNVDDNYKYTIANNMFCQSVGLKENEIIGHTDKELFIKEEAESFNADDRDAIINGIKTIKETVFWQGVKIVWHTTKYSFTTAEGATLLIGLALNITELDNAMRELETAKEKAERSELLKSSFLANMSHEIRTPLNSIVGFSRLIATANTKEEKEEYGKIIDINSDMLLNLINDILDLSKLEAGFIDLKCEEINLTEMLKNLKSAFTIRMSGGVNFKCLIPPEEIIIRADNHRLNQIINNYLSNAIKYTPSGEIELGYKIKDNSLELYVKDTGIGIDKQYHDRVFQRFEKFDSFAQGTGLGLSICKAIAENMGCSVGFTSEIGKGSCFWILIPL